MMRENKGNQLKDETTDFMDPVMVCTQCHNVSDGERPNIITTDYRFAQDMSENEHDRQFFSSLAFAYSMFPSISGILDWVLGARAWAWFFKVDGKQCPYCKKRTMVPSSSGQGKEIMAEIYKKE